MPHSELEASGAQTSDADPPDVDPMDHDMQSVGQEDGHGGVEAASGVPNTPTAPMGDSKLDDMFDDDDDDDDDGADEWPDSSMANAQP